MICFRGNFSHPWICLDIRRYGAAGDWRLYRVLCSISTSDELGSVAATLFRNSFSEFSDSQPLWFCFLLLTLDVRSFHCLVFFFNFSNRIFDSVVQNCKYSKAKITRQNEISLKMFCIYRPLFVKINTSTLYRDLLLSYFSLKESNVMVFNTFYLRNKEGEPPPLPPRHFLNLFSRLEVVVI